jgi:frataxin-like iron-binding protein CyaY
MKCRSLQRYLLQRSSSSQNSLWNRSTIANFTVFQPASRKANSNANKGIPKGSYNFQEEVDKFLQLAYKAVLPLKEQNNFKISFTEGKELKIETQRGPYRIHPDVKNNTMEFQSYQSGYTSYYFEPELKQWLSTKDDHDLRGLLTRDILRHWSGVPQFP